MTSSATVHDLTGATIKSANEGITDEGDTVLYLHTTHGTFEVSALAWSDILANATDGEGDDLTTHVTLRRRA